MATSITYLLHCLTWDNLASAKSYGKGISLFRRIKHFSTGERSL